MRREIATFAILLAAVSATAGRAAGQAVGQPPASKPPASKPPALAFEPFVLTTFDGVRHPAEMGRLRVLENRARPDGPTITLAFVRLRSSATSPAPPTVFLAGGPGVPGTLLARVPPYYALFERLREIGDVILLDQRGSGLSEPTLQCATRGSLPPNAFESEAAAAVALGGILRPCAKMVRRDGHELEAYQTNANADDLEDLRVALGADRLRLIGMSYGTELALAFVRRHGDRVDRIVLAGTRGPDQVWKLPSALDLQLKRVGRLIAADPQYATLLPDLERTVRGMLESLARQPASPEVTDAKSKKKIRLRVGPIGLQAVLQNDICDGFVVGALPAMVASLARGDSLLFSKRMEHIYNSIGSGISVMAVVTDCASGGTPERISRATRERRTSLLKDPKNILLNAAFCELVGSPDLGPESRAPIYSETPALFITGENDGITPPAQAEEVRWGFPNGVHLIAENGWHETLPAPAVQAVVLDFLRGEDVRGRRLTLEATRFLSIEAAKAAAPRP